MGMIILLFDAREMFEAEHGKYLYLMDRNKSTNLWKSMKRYLEECNSSWYFPVLLS